MIKGDISVVAVEATFLLACLYNKIEQEQGKEKARGLLSLVLNNAIKEAEKVSNGN